MLKTIQASHSTKKMLFVRPEKEWTLMKTKTVYMKLNKYEHLEKVFEFIERESYKVINKNL